MKKLFLLAPLVAALLLSSCSLVPTFLLSSSETSPSSSPSSAQSNQPSSQPSQPSQSSQSSQSSQQSQSSYIQTPTGTLVEFNTGGVRVSGEDSKCYFYCGGRLLDNSFTGTKMFAFALEKLGYVGSETASATSVYSDLGIFAYGKGNPLASDFNIPIEVSSGAFEFKICLTDIMQTNPEIGSGCFLIYMGVEGDYGARTSFGRVITTINDDGYRYYTRNDSETRSRVALCIDELPPFHISEATVEQNVTGTAQGSVWAKIGGSLKRSVSINVLDSYDTLIQFQALSRWTITVLTKQNNEFFYRIEGNKAYLYANITFMTSNTGVTYNTHLNVTSHVQANCVTEETIDQNYNLTNYGVSIRVYSHPFEGNDLSNVYGNLGFMVRAL